MFRFLGHKKDITRSNKWIFGTMLVFATMGLIASFVLTIEKFHVLTDPQAVLSCSFNAVLDCSVVMKTWQSSVFGFPNMLIGLMAYPVVITVAVAGLSGIRFPRPFLVAATVCYFLGLVFAYWLFFQSLYAIEVLCPWCLVVTFSTTMIFTAMSQYILRENTFGVSKVHNKVIQKYLQKDISKLVTASWIMLMIALVFIKFGEALFV